jgi:hypothetical protein
MKRIINERLTTLQALSAVVEKTGHYSDPTQRVEYELHTFPTSGRRNAVESKTRRSIVLCHKKVYDLTTMFAGLHAIMGLSSTT